MSGYLVSFYKHLLSSDGHAFRCLQQAIEIRDAHNVEEAVAAAETRFARQRGVPNWDLYADEISIEMDKNKSSCELLYASESRG